MAEDFMDPISGIDKKAEKIKQAGEKIAKSSKDTNKKIQARELLKKVIRSLPWEAKKAALDIIRAEIAAGSGMPSAGTMNPDKLPVDYTSVDIGDVGDYTKSMRKKDFRSGKTTDDLG